MRLKLKENPREWLKFTAVTALAIGLVAALLWKRKIILAKTLAVVLSVLGVGLLVCVVRPRWFRAYYRVGMTVSFAIGQAMGRVLLFVFFLAILTPMALIARIMGKDLLKLKKDSHATTYWQPAKIDNQFDREF